MNEVSKVDGVEQSFYVDAYFSFAYQEPLMDLSAPGADGAELSNENRGLIGEFGVIATEFTNKRAVEVLFETYLQRSAMPRWLARSNPPLKNASWPWVVYDSRVAGGVQGAAGAAQLSVRLADGRRQRRDASAPGSPR